MTRDPARGGTNVEVLPVVGGGEFSGLPQAPSEIKNAISISSSKHFQFVNDENLSNLIYLLKKEPREKTAIVINYLSPDYASKIMASLSVKDQCDIASLLSEVKLLDQNEVIALENDLKGKIDYLVGGADTFINLVDQAERDTQENIVMTMEKENPILAEKLKNSLFFFEDIVILEKTALQKVIRAGQRRGISLAVALKECPEPVKQKVFDVLTEGARAMLTEQITLLGDIPRKRIIDEQRKLANLVRELERVSEIVIDRSTRNGNTGTQSV